LTWDPGKIIVNLYHINNKLEPIQELKLKPKDILELIRKEPRLIPYVKTNNYRVFEDIFIENTKVDLIIAEAHGKSGIALYLIFFKWFKYGRLSEKYRSPGEIYGEIGFDMEMLDEVINPLYTLGKCKKKWARELKNKLKSAFNMKRLVITDIYAIIVVDRLTNEFIQIIDSLNDLIDPYIDALSITVYKHRDHDKIVLVSLYSWRKHI